MASIGATKSGDLTTLAGGTAQKVAIVDAAGRDSRIANWTIDPATTYIDAIIQKRAWTGRWGGVHK